MSMEDNSTERQSPGNACGTGEVIRKGTSESGGFTQREAFGRA